MSSYMRVLTVPFITCESNGTKSTYFHEIELLGYVPLLTKNTYIDGGGTSTDNAVYNISRKYS